MLLLLSFILVISQSSVFALSADEELTAKLVEGAKKEGKVVFYTAMSVSEAVPLLKKFEQKYPFIKTELFSERGEKQVIRIVAEARTGRTVADVVHLGGFQVHLVKKQGGLMKYVSPESRFFPVGFKDSDGYWTDTYINANVLAYNTKLISPKDAPRNFDDLLDPKWKDKLGMDYQEYEWFSVLLKVKGEEKGLEFMRKLSKQNISFRNNRTLLATLVTAGEIPVAATGYADIAERFKRQGAPVEWVPVEPVVVKLHPLAITAQAPHPNSAKLLVDYLLSKEGQIVLKNLGKTPSRSDIEVDSSKLKGIKLFPSDPMEAENYNNVVKLYKSVFGIH